MRSVMPKEHFGEQPERVPQGTSKNAKDKSNSATLRASQGGTHRDQEGRRMGMNGRMSRSDSEKDSEKDSGYSEAGSDSVQIDLDDQRSSEQNPIYVIKNLVVKPSGPEELLHRPLAWGGGWDSLSGFKAPTQHLLIQKPGVPSPVLAPSNLPDPQGQSKKGGSRSNKNHTSKNSYLPILNSYPRIAPHPRKEGLEQGREGAGAVKESSREGQSRSKRVCTEDKREAVSTTTHLRPQQHHHHQRESRTQSHYKVSSSQSSSPHLPHHSMGGPASSTQQGSNCCHQHAKPSPSPSRSNGVGSPSIISSQASSSSSSSSADSWAPEASIDLSDCLSDCSLVRQRRFLNTAEILSQSGLLAITLRTKELLRQNAATEKELAQLRQHAQLLCLAAQTGQEATQQGPNDSPSPMDKLLQAMSQSGRYPSLDWTYFNANGHNHPEKGDEAEKHSSNNNKRCPSQNPLAAASHDDGTSPPSPLLALSPDPEDRPNVLALSPDPEDRPNVLASLLSISPSSPPQGRAAKPLCDLIMHPDSSTHQAYLF
ncbi:hypothetical protein J4Q44_G00244910 [Coregonus suidteri]|uniref:CLOCK-interacting pacemaker-like n=1 Tax=Coregonus suidteri TaxID=861788 RepID=A0AAN8LLK2_9TELE